MSVIPATVSLPSRSASAQFRSLEGPAGQLVSQNATSEADEDVDASDTESETAERPTLSLGSPSGPLMLYVHSQLQKQGYYEGDTRSGFTQETAEAVKKFQADNNLDVTGAVDSATWGPLAGEDADESAPDEAGADGDSGDETSSEGQEGSRSNQQRWLILGAALLGLGAGGFGLWKMLSVPVPKPLDPQDELDPDLDDLQSTSLAVSQGLPLSSSQLSTPMGTKPSMASKNVNGNVVAMKQHGKSARGKHGGVGRHPSAKGLPSAGRGQTPASLAAAQVAIAAQNAAQNGSQAIQSTSPRSAKFATPGSGANSLTPPPPPSDIALTNEAGSLEEQNLVTTRLARVDIVEVLVTDLQSADPAKRRKAIWELGQRSDSRAIKPLVNMMPNSDSRQRSLILAALSEIGTQTLKPMKQALAISLQDENPEVRKNAIRDLTRIYDLVAQISHLLNAALEDPDPEVQDTARWALKQLNRIRSTTAIEGSQPQQMLQQSVSPPESFSEQHSNPAPAPQPIPNPAPQPKASPNPEKPLS